MNEKLAKRPGGIGRFFKAIEMGKREYGTHSFHRLWRVVNFFWIKQYQVLCLMRPVGSRFFGQGNGPLNYTGLFVYIFATLSLLSTTTFQKHGIINKFNYQDGAEFWFERYRMMFPPNFLHNRVSAHYIEINNIFFNEMIKKYHYARKDIIDERERCSEKERRTRYVTNPNYIYEPFKNDAAAIAQQKARGEF